MPIGPRRLYTDSRELRVRLQPAAVGDPSTNGGPRRSIATRIGLARSCGRGADPAGRAGNLGEQKMIMKTHFAMMADYNAWANGRLFEIASRLPDDQYRRNVGAYFKSLHGTLNHILVADRIWMRRLTGAGDHPGDLNAIVFDDFPSLRAARQQEDQRIIRFIEGLSEAGLEEMCDYRTLSGTAHTQPRREILAHLFNHQTHHRGQAHAILTILGVCEPDGLDLLLMQREHS